MTKLLHGNEKNRLNGGREPLFSQKELLVLAVPLLVEQLLEVTVGMADTMMVSRCGEAAISGVSLVDMINNLIIVLFAALATGGAVVVSQYLGAKERGNADKSAGQLLLLSGLSGVVIGVVCFVLARPMIRLFYGSIDTDVLDAGVKYLQIIALSYPFLALYNGGAALFRSMGNSKISMQISFLMNIINIVGNAVCIFGFKMGVDGVAWPSVVSRVVAAALIPLLHSGGLHKGNNMQAVFSDSAAPDSDMAPAAADENSAERLAPDNAMDGATPSDRETQQKSDTAGKDVTGGCPNGENLYTAAPAQTMDEALARAAETLAQQGFVLAVTAREESAVQVLLTNAAGSAGDLAVLTAASSIISAAASLALRSLRVGAFEGLVQQCANTKTQKSSQGAAPCEAYRATNPFEYAHIDSCKLRC